METNYQILTTNTHTLNAKDAAVYVAGGFGIFTLKNTNTKTRFTFKLKKSKDTKILFVYYLCSPEMYAYCGYVRVDNKSIFIPAYKKGYNYQTPVCVYATWLFKSLFSNETPRLGNAEFWHEGICGCCGRQLTVPESIASGIGPVCALKI